MNTETKKTILLTIILTIFSGLYILGAHYFFHVPVQPTFFHHHG